MITPGKGEQLPRRLGLWGVWMLVVNGLIGAGIFGLPGKAAALTGSYSVFVYLICALLMLPVILSFAELSGYFSGTGGPIKYGTEAFGSFVGFQSGWLYYMARLISFSANSVLLTDSLGYFFDSLTHGYGRLITLALICGLLTLINVLGSSESIFSLTAFTVIKFLVLLLLIVGGMIMVAGDILPDLSGPLPSADNAGSAVLILVYAFVGFEGGIVPSGETKEPQKTMPKAFVLGLFSVAVLYMFIQLTAEALVRDLADSTTPLLDAADALMGNTGALVLMIGVIASVTGNLMSNIFSTTRITYAMSINGMLPAWFGKVHPGFKTPARSIWFFGVLAFTGAAFGSFTFLAAMTVFARALLYLISCGAVMRLRNRFREQLEFVLKGGFSIPILGIIACIWLMFQVSFTSVWLTVLFVIIGTILYLIGQQSGKSSFSESE